jgi:hypothetical protein
MTIAPNLRSIVEPDSVARFQPIQHAAGREIYLGCFRDYLSSAEGAHQLGQPLRYGRFGDYGRSAIVADLGDDLDPVLHMPVTEATFLRLASDEGDEISPRDVYEGGLTLISHDIGENTHDRFVTQFGSVVGDIPQGCKTDEDRRVEGLIWDDLFAKYFGVALPANRHQRIKELVTHQEDSDLHHALEAAHDTNSLRVGLRAGKIALSELQQGNTDSDRFAILRPMSVTVCINSSPRVEKHAARFVLPRRLLSETEKLQDRILAELS